MEEFFIKLNFKQFQVFGSVYGQINTSTIILLGIILPIFNIIGLIYSTYYAINSELIYLYFSIIFLLLGLVSTPYRLYKKIPNYYRIRRIEKNIEEKKYQELLELLKADKKTSILIAYLLSKLEKNVMNDELLNIMESTKYEIICENIAQYLIKANQEIAMNVFEKLERTTSFFRKRNFLKILHEFNSIEDYVTLKEYLNFMEKESTSVFFPFIFHILNYYKKDLHLIIPILNNMYDTFPHYDIPFVSIKILKKTKNEKAIQVLQKIRNKFSEEYLIMQIDLAIIEIQKTIENNQIVISTDLLSGFTRLRDSISTRISSSQVQTDFETKFDEWLDIIKSENFRISTLTSFFDELQILTKSISTIWEFETKLINNLDILITQGESDILEFKEAIVTRKAQLKFAKSVAAIHNRNGGLIIIGVDNSNQPKGINKDIQQLITNNYKDEFRLKINKILRDRLRVFDLNFISIHFVNYREFELCIIKVNTTEDYILMKDNSFYIRNGNEDTKLPTDKMLEYTTRNIRKKTNLN